MFRNTFRRRPSLALAGILIAIGGCAENPSAASHEQFVARAAHARFSVSGATASAVVDARGGTIVTAAGDRIVFPAGALAEATTIRITSDDTYLGVTLEPHGLQFPAGHEPVLILNAAGSNAAALPRVDVAYVDEGGNVAEILDATRTTATVSTNLHHFSGYTAISH